MILRLLLVLSLFVWQPGFAAEMRALFTTEVIAFSQDPADRDVAIHDALTIVLQRILTGTDMLDDPAVQTALEQAPALIKDVQYSFAKNEFDPNTPARIMRITFDDVALLDLLKDSQQGIWNEIRPETLVWLVIDDRGKRDFFSRGSMSEINTLLQRAGRQQGLPLIFPLLDLQEQRTLSFDQIVQPHSQQLLQLSNRYNVVSILAGRLINREWCWESEWTLYFDQDVQHWTGECNAMYDTLLEGMRGVYDKLSRYYSVKPGIDSYTPPPSAIVNTPTPEQTSLVQIDIEGIDNSTDMNRASRYLESLPSVAGVSLMGVDAGINHFSINLSGKRQLFEQRLKQDSFLIAIQPTANKRLRYRLNRRH